MLQGVTIYPLWIFQGKILGYFPWGVWYKGVQLHNKNRNAIYPIRNITVMQPLEYAQLLTLRDMYLTYA